MVPKFPRKEDKNSKNVIKFHSLLASNGSSNNNKIKKHLAVALINRSLNHVSRTHIEALNKAKVRK